MFCPRNPFFRISAAIWFWVGNSGWTPVRCLQFSFHTFWPLAVSGVVLRCDIWRRPGLSLLICAYFPLEMLRQRYLLCSIWGVRYAATAFFCKEGWKQCRVNRGRLWPNVTAPYHLAGSVLF